MNSHTRGRFQVSLRCRYPFTAAKLARQATGVSSDDVVAVEQPTRHWALEGCVLAQLRREFGSVEGYVAHLGLSSAIDDLRAALLEK